jgi:hypothetical protein
VGLRLALDGPGKHQIAVSTSRTHENRADLHDTQSVLHFTAVAHSCTTDTRLRRPSTPLVCLPPRDGLQICTTTNKRPTGTSTSDTEFRHGYQPRSRTTSGLRQSGRAPTLRDWGKGKKRHPTARRLRLALLKFRLRSKQPSRRQGSSASNCYNKV